MLHFLRSAVLLANVLAQVLAGFFFLHVFFHDHCFEISAIFEILHVLQKRRPVFFCPGPVDGAELPFFSSQFLSLFLAVPLLGSGLVANADGGAGVPVAVRRATTRRSRLAAAFLLLFGARLAAA